MASITESKTSKITLNLRDILEFLRTTHPGKFQDVERISGELHNKEIDHLDEYVAHHFFTENDSIVITIVSQETAS